MQYSRIRFFGLLSIATCVVASLSIATADESSAPENQEVQFTQHIAPLLSKNCIACHNAKKAEGGLNLETHQAIMLGGDSGAAVVAGNLDGSNLFARIIDKDDPMPPVGNSVGARQLTDAEVALVRVWISAGAAAPIATESVKMQWQPLPVAVRPINALAASMDGNYLALGRGNQAFVVRQPMASGLDQAYNLVDPAVAEALQASVGSLSLDPNAVQAAQLDIVQSIAFSPDSSRVAAGGYRSLKIWQRTLEAIESLETGLVAGQAALVSLSPNGQQLAVSLDGKVPEIIHLPSYQSWRSLRNHSAAVTAIAWLDDANLLSCDANGGWFIHALASEKVSKPISGVALPLSKQLLRLTSDRLLAITTEGKLAELKLNLQGLTMEARLVEGFEHVVSLAAGTTGPVAVGLETGICRLIKPDELTTLREITTSGPVQLLSISDNGSLVVTSTGSAPAQLWKAEDGAAIATLDRDYRYNQLIASSQRDINRQQGLIERLTSQQAEQKKLAEAEQAALAKVQEMRDKAATDLASREGELTTANQAAEEGQKLMAEAEAALAAALKMVETRKTELEAKQKMVAEAMTKKEAATTELASRDQALATSKEATEKALARVPEIEATIEAEKQRLVIVQQESTELTNNPAAKHQPRQLAFSADNQRVVVADEQGRLHLYTTQGGSPEANLLAASPTSAITTTATGQLISLSTSGTLQRWDMGLTWKLERVIGDFQDSPFSDRITAMDFSPDGKFLAVGGGPPSRFGEIKIVDLESGQIVKDLGQIHTDTVLALRYSPDGRKLATGGADKLCRILDADSGKQIVSLEGHTHHVLSVAWKDDGVTLATGSADQTIKVWNVETATQNRTIGGSKKEITALAFVAQSNQLIAVDAGGQIRLLDAGGGNQVRAYAGATGAVLTATVTADGKILYAGGQSGSNWAWQVEDAKQLR